MHDIMLLFNTVFSTFLERYEEDLDVGLNVLVHIFCVQYLK
jgi:hypothetical protein